MSKKYILTEETTDRVCPDTGHVLVTSTKKTTMIKVDSEDEFFQTYYNNLSPLYGLSGKEIKVLMQLNTLAFFNTGEVALTPARRKDLCATVEITPGSLSNILKKLTTVGLLEGAKSTYVINPAVFWKGDKSKRRELLASGKYSLKIETTIVDNEGFQIQL